MVYTRLEPWLSHRYVRVLGVVAVVVLFAVIIGATGTVAAQSTVGQDGNFTDMTGQDEVVVEVGAGPSGFKFDSADIKIDPGTTVRWVWTGRGGQHNVIQSDGVSPLDDPAFESELIGVEGHEFTYTFEEPGTYDYVCSPHIAQGMIGSVEVVGDSSSPVDGVSDELWDAVTTDDGEDGLSFADLGNAIQKYQKNPSDADVGGVSIDLSDLGSLIQYYRTEVV
jgi:halocyanin-like protein